jgi:N-acetyl-gamma-glutamyl-phosphate reductase
MKVAILGAAGYTGCELLRLLSSHPVMVPALLIGRSDVGKTISELFPSLDKSFNLEIQPFNDPLGRVQSQLIDCELIFSALPHGQLGTMIAENREFFSGVKRIVDLASDFRLRDPASYTQWYGSEHPCPDELSKWNYSIPEINRGELKGATRIANAGCFATAFILGLAPLIQHSLVAGPLSGVGISGTSGAGKGLSSRLHFSHLFEDVVTYRVSSHQHGGEIEQAIAALSQGTSNSRVSLSTVLAPMSRGLQVIITASTSDSLLSGERLREIYQRCYSNENFITVRDTPPDTKNVRGANRAEIYPHYDERTGLITIVSVIDNLVKGAAGSANLVLGLDETCGLPKQAMYP